MSYGEQSCLASGINQSGMAFMFSTLGHISHRIILVNKYAEASRRGIGAEGSNLFTVRDDHVGTG